MTENLTFLHTLQTFVDTFNGLLEERSLSLEATHVVDENLLRDAREAGEITDEIDSAVSVHIEKAAADGAKVVLCTCSTIGGCAEQVQLPGCRVIRIDRPMADKAVEIGTVILVAAALESTIGPTGELIQDSARQAGKQVRIRDVVCEGAWDRFEQGDNEGYHERIAKSLRANAEGSDVVVLAQASMASAAKLCEDLPVPVLSSPELGMAAAIEALEALE